MPKFPTFPVIIDNKPSLSISQLKIGKENKVKRASFSLETKRGYYSIDIKIDLSNESVTFTYRHNGTTKENAFKLSWRISNLGNGKIYYFVCNRSQKRCRKLYFIDNDFLSRHALLNYSYYDQTLSHQHRDIKASCYGYEREIKAVKDELKTVLKVYAGKATKRYSYLINRLDYLNDRAKTKGAQINWRF